MQGLRVGFVGLGDIGEPMARRLVDADFPVTLWARRAASLEPFRNTTEKSDVVDVAVFNEDDVLRWF
jgi:3-hydroxyisobutyrate dehydrogenase